MELIVVGLPFFSVGLISQIQYLLLYPIFISSQLGEGFFADYSPSPIGNDQKFMS
jgi:hypothetical protein